MPEQVKPAYSKINEAAALIVSALQIHGWGDEATSTMNEALLRDRAEQVFEHEEAGKQKW